jgi:hypothetical protein
MNPMATIPDERLETMHEHQNQALEMAIRNGNVVLAKRMNAALDATEAEAERRGLFAAPLTRVTDARSRVTA